MDSGVGALENWAIFMEVICVSSLNETLQLNNLETRTTMNAKISAFVICVEAVVYLLLYNLHDYLL